jgi:hypothetical protein
MSTTTAPQRSVDVRARIVQIERDHAEVNFPTVNHYWKRVGLKYQDALRAEELEREVDRLEATAAAVGLSEEERARLSDVSAVLDRFVASARCHAEKQAERKPITEGRSITEQQDDGSTWVIGTDPKPGVDREVCVAAFEMAQDAEHVAQIHNRREDAQAPPIEVERTSNVVTVCVDSADRMKALLHLTTPAGFDPAHSVEQVAAYEWQLVFHSITEAGRFEQLARDASRLAAA